MVQDGVLERIGRGKFVLGTEKRFQPEINPRLRKIYQDIHREFPFVNQCVWNTSDLNEFMIHQPFRFFNLVEVDKEATNSVFYFLQKKHRAVFIDPDKEILEKYLPDNKTSVIIRSLVSEAPLQSVDGVKTATLEKILVDLFCDTTLFSAYQGREMATIFREAFEKYTIHQDKMFRYARRRGKQSELKTYLNKTKLPAVNID